MKREEAIEIVRNIYQTDAEKEALAVLIPELCESEDERIRKALIKVFTDKYKKGYEWKEFGIPNRSVLDWLEKQKENPKSADSISSDCTSDEKYEDRWHKVGDSLPDNGREVLAKDKLGNILLARYDGEGWDVSVYDDEDYRCHNGISKWCEIPSEKQKEQKPVEQNSASGNSENPNNHVGWKEEYREEDLRTRFAFYTYKDEDNALYLSNVFVDEAYRNSGFGTRILKAAEKVAESGATTICLKVKQNSPANAWYRKHGYGYLTFEGDYDWLGKKLEYLKPTKQQKEKKSEQYSPLCNTIKDKIREYIANHFIADTVVKTDMRSIVKAMEEGVRLGKEEQKPAEIDEYEIIKKHITRDSLSSEVNKRLIECGWYFPNEKPAEWSEEDERILKGIIGLIDHDQHYGVRNKEMIAWLKSRRPQPHWKPTEEQMNTLRYAAGGNYVNLGILESLYNELKNL